jgi:hypothetical protein
MSTISKDEFPQVVPANAGAWDRRQETSARHVAVLATDYRRPSWPQNVWD